MSDFLEVLPMKVVALVVGPMLLGLVLLAALFKLPPLVWSVILLTVIAGLLLLIIIGARAVLMEKQAGMANADEE